MGLVVNIFYKIFKELRKFVVNEVPNLSHYCECILRVHAAIKRQIPFREALVGWTLRAMCMNISYNSPHEKRVLIGGSPTLDPESPFKEFNLNSIYSIYDFV